MPAPSEQKVYAVLTGDMIGSTKLTRGDMAKVRETITQSVRSFVVRNDRLDRDVEFFQGDSWQVVLGNPEYALRLAFLIQASLKSKTNTETRAAIGIGMVDGLERTAAVSTGEAFTLSGRALENMSNAIRLTGALPVRAGVPAEWFPTLLHLCSGLMRGWSRRQAEVIGLWLSLSDPTYESIASQLNPPIAKQSVSDILTSANLQPLYEAMVTFHATRWRELIGPE
jgi:hypothetical protein